MPSTRGHDGDPLYRRLLSDLSDPYSVASSGGSGDASKLLRTDSRGFLGQTLLGPRSAGGNPMRAKADWGIAPLCMSTAQTVTNAGVGAGNIVYYPILVPNAETTVQLTADVTLAQSGALMKAGIYDLDESTLEPGSLLGQAAEMALSSTGKVSGALAIALDPGIHFVGLNANDGTVDVTGVDKDYAAPVLGTRNASSFASVITVLVETGSYGDLPATASPNVNAAADVPIVLVEF